MSRGLPHRMRGYVRVVLLPVAVMFLALGQQIACASDLSAVTPAPQFFATDQAAGDASLGQYDGQPHRSAASSEQLSFDCPDCVQLDPDCQDHFAGDGCVVSVETGPAMVQTATLDGPKGLSTAAANTADYLFEVSDPASDGPILRGTAPIRSSLVAPYLRHCSFRE
jgi:hypothetical protein